MVSSELGPTPESTAAPVYAVTFDMSRVTSPVVVRYGTPEEALPLPGHGHPDLAGRGRRAPAIYRS